MGNLSGNSLGLGGNLGQLGSEYLGQLTNHQLGGNNLGGNLGGNLGSNLGGGPSLLEMQRAENLLAAMASNNGMQNIGGMGQLSSMMNANSQAALLQSRLGGNLLGPNTQLPSLSQDSLLNKNQMLSSLASNHGLPGGINSLGQLGGDDGSNLGKRRRSFGDGSMSPLRKRPSHGGGTGRLSGGSEMKLAADLVALEEAHAMRGNKPEPKSRRKAKTFPVKLMQALIENPDEEAVAWLPDGKSFVIVQPDLFVDIVLKKTFKECKYASFVRKLHRWGFVRLTSGTGTDCFHHPLFQRNRTDLCSRIVCTPRDPAKASETEKRVAAATSMTNDKPPSLAGVEKFFRSKPLGSAAPAAPTAASLALPKELDEKSVPPPKEEEKEEVEDDHVDDGDDEVPTEEASV